MKKPVDLHFLYLVALASCLLAISLQAATKEAPATKTEDRSRADLASQKQPDSAEPVRFPSTYVEFYRQVLEDYRKGFTAWPGGKPRRLAPGFIDKTSLAEAAYLLWKKTGDPACPALAKNVVADSAHAENPASAQNGQSPAEKVVGAAPFANPKTFFTAEGTPDYRAFYRDFVENIADSFFTPANCGSGSRG